VSKDGLGSCLSRSGERCNSPIGCPLEDRPGEIGDGNLLNSVLGHTQTFAEPQSQQYTQPQVPSRDAGEPGITGSQQNVPIDDLYNPNPLPQLSNSRKRKNKKIKKNTRASLKIASLNMRGRGSTGENKWNDINQIMREQRIGVLAVQEAHLTQDHVDNLHTLFGKRLQIHFLQGPNTNAQGVAIVLNKELTNVKGIDQIDVIPGRAMLITLPWHSDLSLTVLNIYAPNSHTENQTFWETLNSEWDRLDLPIPDIMLGDFNIVEDALDRLPSHTDPHHPVDNLDNLWTKFQLKDGWRTTNPETKCFSFLQKGTGIQSRIDRIYASDNIIKTASDWMITTTAINTDHKMVSVRVVDQKVPYIGKGRWTMPLNLLKDKDLIQDIQILGRELEQNMDIIQERSVVTNPQVLFKNFKDATAKKIRKKAKVAIPKMNQQIECLQQECKKLLKEPTIDTIESQCSLGILEEKIAQLENQRYKKARTATAAHDKLEGETISKYWSKVNKSQTPRDVIYTLEKPGTNPVEYVTRSDKMAEVARNYHHDLLLAGLNTPPDERETVIKEVLETIDPEKVLSEEDGNKLGQKLTEQDVLEALKASKNGTSTGVEGLPYELWKTLNNKYETDSKVDAPTFNIIKTLTRVYNDIEEYGVAPNTDFAAGWMCPLYKKKDKKQIVNYRPITLLNSDYKIFTKALAVKLAKSVPVIIHENQAGFIPGRSIFDQVKQTKLMVDYAEAIEENGVIVALDQEKAYDKISHDYLWRTLAKYNLPNNFITTVRSLYENAETRVMVNGVLSTPFVVSRGVRQGDPMSCLLFDIAIEPLANMLRCSGLKGFEIPGVKDRLITTLFADDTTVFLSEFDKFTDLEAILNKWCIASGARFNVGKTEVTPIGTTTYRKDVVNTRCIHPTQEPLAQDIHIAQEQEPVRILGAWIGNNIDQNVVWSTVLDKIRDNLNRWNMGHPTLFGRRLIIQMVVGGMTQYLAKVQTMPKQVEDTLEKIIRNFMWNGNKAPVSISTLHLPIEQGGVKLLDLRARNQAINIMWLKTYLDLSPKRPTWAYITDALISNNISRASGQVATLAQVNTYLQSWKPSLHTSSNLPKDIIQMLKTGQNSGISFEALKLSDALKEQLPAWYHLGTNQQMTSLNNHKASKCLREKHLIKTVGDLVQTTKRGKDTTSTHTHRNRINCACQYCRHDRQIYACLAPNKCYITAKALLSQLNEKWNPDNNNPIDGLTHTPNRKLANANTHSNGEKIIFDPSVTSDNDLSHNFRVFTAPEAKCIDPAYRKHPLAEEHEEEATAYIDGACSENGYENAQAGGGVWFGPDNLNNTAIKIPGLNQSTCVGKLAAVLYLVQKTPPFAPLHIISDSKYIVESFTKKITEWEECGWINIPNKEFIKPIVSHLRARGAITTFKKETGQIGSKNAKVLANAGEQCDALDLNPNRHFNLTGAQLSLISQATAYRGLRERGQVASRLSTIINLDITRHAVNDLTGHMPTDAQMWHSIRSKDITRTIRVFLWKVLHKTQKCGDYWLNIPTFEHRGTCFECGVEDSITHILTECSTPGQSEIWNLAKKVWLKKHDSWPTIKGLGLIVGCCMAKFHNEKSQRKFGAERLYRILMTESAHLIWRIRCERVLERSDRDQWHTAKEISNRWQSTLNKRLALDQAMTSRKYGSKAIKAKTVLHTWSGILQNEQSLPDDWIGFPGVLVGIGPPEWAWWEQHGPEPP